MLMPQKMKYRRHQRGKMKGASKGGTQLNFGEIGLKATGTAWITSRQIESARVAMTRHIKRGGKVWITIFPDKSVSKKPAETRQGSGKGAPEFWVARVQPGRIMFELGGVNPELAKRALELAAAKLPVKCKIVEKEEVPL